MIIFSSMDNPMSLDASQDTIYPEVKISILPLKESMGVSPQGKLLYPYKLRQPITLDIIDVPFNIPHIWESLSWTVLKNDFHFTEHFLKLITLRFLEERLDALGGMWEHTVMSKKNVDYLIDLYQMDTLLSVGTIFVEKPSSFVQDVRNGIYPFYKIQELSKAYHQRVTDFIKYNTSYLKHTLEPMDVIEFNTNIRKAMALELGINYTAI